MLFRSEAAGKQKTLDFLRDWNFFVDELGLSIDNDANTLIKPEERAAAMLTARMQPGAVVADKKTGETFKVVRVSGRGTVIQDSNGKQKVFKKENYRLIRDAKGAPADLSYLTSEDATSFAIASLYETFADYMKHMAQLKKGYIFDEDINNAFRDIKDFVYLSRDQIRQVNTINKFANPEIQDIYVNSVKNVIALARQNRANNMQKAVRTFYKRKRNNKLLNRIYDIGLFVLPQDIAKLTNFEPVDFYDHTAKDNPDRKSTRLNSSHVALSRMPSSA